MAHVDEPPPQHSEPQNEHPKQHCQLLQQTQLQQCDMQQKPDAEGGQIDEDWQLYL